LTLIKSVNAPLASSNKTPPLDLFEIKKAVRSESRKALARADSREALVTRSFNIALRFCALRNAAAPVRLALRGCSWKSSTFRTGAASDRRGRAEGVNLFCQSAAELIN
jgi:hypothetical protein